MVYWKIEFKDKANKSLGKLSYDSKKIIQNYLNNKVLKLNHPKQLGKPLTASLKGLWRYRVDKFRIICEIQEHKLVVLVVQIGSSDNIYS